MTQRVNVTQTTLDAGELDLLIAGLKALGPALMLRFSPATESGDAFCAGLQVAREALLARMEALRRMSQPL